MNKNKELKNIMGLMWLALFLSKIILLIVGSFISAEEKVLIPNIWIHAFFIFGIVSVVIAFYGLEKIKSAEGLSNIWSIGREEPEALRDSYFVTFIIIHALLFFGFMMGVIILYFFLNANMTGGLLLMLLSMALSFKIRPRLPVYIQELD